MLKLLCWKSFICKGSCSYMSSYLSDDGCISSVKVISLFGKVPFVLSFVVAKLKMLCTPTFLDVLTGDSSLLIWIPTYNFNETRLGNQIWQEAFDFEVTFFFNFRCKVPSQWSIYFSMNSIHQIYVIWKCFAAMQPRLFQKCNVITSK